MLSIIENGLTEVFKYGTAVQVKLINYSISAGSYDDTLVQTLIGSFVTSGVEFPIRSKFGSSEALMLQQGRLLTSDKIIFIGGSPLLSNYSSGLLVGLGNGPELYTVIPDGNIVYKITGSPVYQKLYLRQTLSGSIF